MEVPSLEECRIVTTDEWLTWCVREKATHELLKRAAGLESHLRSYTHDLSRDVHCIPLTSELWKILAKAYMLLGDPLWPKSHDTSCDYPESDFLRCAHVAHFVIPWLRAKYVRGESLHTLWCQQQQSPSQSPSAEQSLAPTLPDPPLLREARELMDELDSDIFRTPPRLPTPPRSPPNAPRKPPRVSLNAQLRVGPNRIIGPELDTLDLLMDLSDYKEESRSK